MTPSLPIELPVNTKFMIVQDSMPCSMLRLGHSCENDADTVFVCPCGDGRRQFVAVCQLCLDEVSGYMQATTGQTFAAWLEQHADQMVLS